MRIIKQGNLNAKNENKIATVYVCSKCGAEVEVDAGEIVKSCPCCGSRNGAFAPKITNKLLSAGEAFPEKYFRFGESEESVKLSDEEVRNMIDKTVQKYLRSNCGYCYSGTGDTFIAVFQSDINNINDYFAVVGKNYYEIDSCELKDDRLEEEE